MNTPRQKTVIAIIGCGFVADYYMATLANYPWIVVAGAFDIDAERLRVFTDYYRLARYQSIDHLLDDQRVAIVVNLTNPKAHYDISRRCLEAGKHVYSEKPLAMEYEQAEALVALAEENHMSIVSAPCSLLGNAAQTLWRGVRDKAVGRIRLIYAELDDGMVHKMPYRKWKSASGAPWPYADEFETGCTLEHAGYYLSWLMAMFGPVGSVTAEADCLIPDKSSDPSSPSSATPDFSVGILKFECGVIARLTTSIVGPHNHSIQIIGDTGILGLEECWDNGSAVYVRKLHTIRRKTFLSPFKARYRIAGTPRSRLKKTGGSRMDFAAGIAELASSLREGRACRLSPRFSLHVNEVALALHGVHGVYTTRSRFEPVAPLEWAAGAIA
jgi:predicted dehydrogenase